MKELLRPGRRKQGKGRVHEREREGESKGGRKGGSERDIPDVAAVGLAARARHLVATLV